MRLRAIFLLTLTLVLIFYQFPPQGMPLPFVPLANILLVVLIGLATVYGRSHILSKKPLLFFSGLITAAALISVFASEDRLGDTLFAIRILVLSPIGLVIAGFATAKQKIEDIPYILLPPAFFGVLLMSWALTKPFTGEFSSDIYIWNEGRVFINPLSKLPMWPVTLSENCAAGFLLFFFLFGCLNQKKTLMMLPAVIGAISISIVSATRTYFFATMAVFLVSAARRSILDKRYRDFLIGFGFLVSIVLAIIIYKPARTITEKGFERFFSGDGLFGSSERVDIWHDRFNIARGLPWLESLGVTNYFDRFELSSHNLWIDYWLMGGHIYVLTVSLLVLYILKQAFRLLTTRRLRPQGLASAYGFFTLFGVSFISSPVVSSPMAHLLFWFLGGCVLGSNERGSEIGSNRNASHNSSTQSPNRLRPNLVNS